MFQSHLCKNNHPPKSLYGNFGTTRVICVLASPCRHSTPSVIRNSRLPHFAFRGLALKFRGSPPPPLAIFRLPNVSCFHSFWTPISWPFLSRFQYPGIQPRPSALVDNSPGGRGVLPYIAYTGMCRPTGSWFWSSWLRTGYPFQRRFLERGIKNCRSRLYVLLKIVAVYEEAFTWCISRTNKEISF